MSQKTESSEFAPGFLWQLCLLTAVVLGFVIYAGKTTFWVRSNVVQDPGAALFPWIIAGKQTIENGVAAFSGRPPKLPAAVDQADQGSLHARDGVLRFHVRHANPRSEGYVWLDAGHGR
jgi:hypothetical protein